MTERPKARKRINHRVAMKGLRHFGTKIAARQNYLLISPAAIFVRVTPFDCAQGRLRRESQRLTEKTGKKGRRAQRARRYGVETDGEGERRGVFNHRWTQMDTDDGG
jgi:hypothetical protein